MRTSRWTRGAMIAGAWTLVGLLSLSPNLLGTQPLRLKLAAATFESVWLWAGFTPLIWLLAARFPITRGRFWRALFVHLLIGLGFNGLDILCDRLLLALLGFSFKQSLFSSFAEDLFLNMFSYIATVVCGHALAYAALSQERRLREIQLGAELARAQLRALEMQLRPHFLFNALHSVGSLIRADQGQAAIRTLAELGDLLRAILGGDGSHEGTVKEELELALRYLRIEELRFGDRLVTHIAVAPEALPAFVPRLVLQPLVENAVRHGVAAKVGPARIDLRASVEDGMVWLTVRDDGQGESGASSDGQGIGLANTRARLERLYGDRHRLELEQPSGGGFVARVGVPYHTHPAHPAEVRA